MIAGNPDHTSEAWHGRAQNRLHVLEGLAEIAAEDEPVLVVIREGVERPAVHLEADVDIAERKEPQNDDST